MHVCVYQISEMTSLHQWLAWINYNHGIPSTVVFFPRYLLWCKSVVPCNTTLNCMHELGSCDLGHSLFQTVFKGSCAYCPLDRASQIWSLYLEAINVYPPKFRGSCVPGHTPLL